MKKLKITFLALFTLLFWHAMHSQAVGNTNGLLADGTKDAGYIITLFDFEQPLGTDGYSLESTWGHIAHGVVDNPNQNASNHSDKVYMANRQAGNWNSGIKFVLDADLNAHGKSKARIQVHPLERPTFVYLKFIDENDVTQVEGWCTWSTFPAGEWSYAVFNNSLEGISFRKVEVYFSDDWGNTTAEATTYFDNLELYNDGDEYLVHQRNAWEFDDPDDDYGLKLDHEWAAGDASFEDNMLKMTLVPDMPWGEPCVFSKNMDNWMLGDLKYFWMKIKNESAGNDVGFTAMGGDDWFGLHRVKIPTNDNMFRDVIIDITDPARWWSNFPESLNTIRFDGPKGADTGVYYVDFYRFVEDFPLADAIEDVIITAPFNTAYGLDHLIQFHADVTFEEHVVAYIKTGVTWSVSDETIATISEDGLLTPIAAGEVTVYATSDMNPDVNGSFEVTVLDSYEIRTAWEFDDPNDTGLNLSHESAAGIPVIEDGMLKVTLVPDMPWQEPNVWSEYTDYWPLGDLKYFWMRIKNESAGNGVGFTAKFGDDWYGIHRVNIPTNADEFTDVMIDLANPASWWGTIPTYINEIRFDGPKGVDEGTYYVDFYKFVSQRPHAESIVISSPFDDLYGVGSTVTLSAMVMPAIASQDVTWSVDDESVATINSDTGVLTAVSTGAIVAKATAKDGSDVYGTKIINVSKTQCWLAQLH
jgi:hypothetical protein